jgi:hypothetical protein
MYAHGYVDNSTLQRHTIFARRVTARVHLRIHHALSYMGHVRCVFSEWY